MGNIVYHRYDPIPISDRAVSRLTNNLAQLVIIRLAAINQKNDPNFKCMRSINDYNFFIISILIGIIIKVSEF